LNEINSKADNTILVFVRESSLQFQRSLQTD